MLSEYEKQARNRSNSLFLDVHDTPAAFEEKYRREIGALTEANSTGMDYHSAYSTKCTVLAVYPPVFSKNALLLAGPSTTLEIYSW